VPEGQILTKARLVRAAGLRWPVEEDFEFAKDHLGLDQCQARLHTAIARHTVLVMAALAICAVAAAQLKERTDTQAAPPNTPDQPPPAEPGMIPLTVPKVQRLLAVHTRPCTSQHHPVTPLTGVTGAADTKPEHAGSTNAHVSGESTPWSASNWRLPC